MADTDTEYTYYNRSPGSVLIPNCPNRALAAAILANSSLGPLPVEAVKPAVA